MGDAVSAALAAENPPRCGRPRSGRLLGLMGRHSSRAAPPAPALRRRRCRQAWSRRPVLQSQAALAAAGFDLPTWDAVILGAQAPPQSNEPGDHLPEPSARGWQAPAAAAVAAHLQTELLAQLDVPSQALLFSQTGPFSSRPFTTPPAPVRPHLSVSSPSCLVHSGVEAARSSVQQPACAARPQLE